MAKLILGERVGKEGKLMIGTCAVIFDPEKQRILLTRRADNSRWCLPGGAIDPGESVSEACIREVWEETGLEIKIERLIGVYSNPHRLIRYADGNQFHLISFSFAAEITGGSLGLSDETTEFGYFSWAEIEHLDLMEHHLERIQDAYSNQDASFVR